MIRGITIDTKIKAYDATFGSIRMRNMPKLIRKAGYENGMKFILSEDFINLDEESRNKVFVVMQDCVANSRGI